MSRLPAFPLRDFDRKPDLSIEPMERRLRIRDDRLHFDHQQRARARVKREDIDRATFSPDRERDFDLDRPSEASKTTDDQLHDRGVALVHEPVQLLSAPPQPDVEICSECCGSSDHGAHRDAIDPAAIDQRDLGSREARVNRDVGLATLEANPEGSELTAESKSIHSRMVTDVHSLAHMGGVARAASNGIRSFASQGVRIHEPTTRARRFRVNGLGDCHLIAFPAAAPLTPGRTSPCAVLTVIRHRTGDDRRARASADAAGARLRRQAIGEHFPRLGRLLLAGPRPWRGRAGLDLAVAEDDHVRDLLLLGGPDLVLHPVR